MSGLAGKKTQPHSELGTQAELEPSTLFYFIIFDHIARARIALSEQGRQGMQLLP